LDARDDVPKGEDGARIRERQLISQPGIFGNTEPNQVPFTSGRCCPGARAKADPSQSR
jgi:hypothetical protein